MLDITKLPIKKWTEDFKKLLEERMREDNQ